MRRIRWTGLTPVHNIFGDWQPGEVKLIFDGTVMPGFEDLDKPAVTPPALMKKFRRRRMREELQDKFERDNLEDRD